ncbi:glutamate-1-semialdehyde 2,1-aminomutase, partial [Candidatus Bipolaricaulota bacterium]|nr:glutamate-1-semialdehyde 2,1-aminomutase [Candidatus Bipolaricaulota bacterium]
DGSKLTDVEGNQYIDYCMGYGPLLLGHGLPEPVEEKVKDQIDRGVLFGLSGEIEVEFAEFLVERVPSLEMVRFVNSGSEATMAAIRTIRGYTNKDKIVKIAGGFHGAHDSVLVEAGSGAVDIPASDGIPEDFVRHTLQVPFNDPGKLEEVLENYSTEIAGIIMEPMMGNAGVIPPENGYLERVRELADEHDVLLVFDEVITGFRLGLGGAQEYFGITPDLTTMGKIAGGGFPIGLFGGKREIMSEISPQGNTYEAGTFNGHPVALVAGYNLLKYVEKEGVHDKVNSLGERLREGLKKLTEGTGYQVAGLGSTFKVFFTDLDRPPRNYSEAKSCRDEEWKKEFRPKMLDEGIFLPPSQYETQFISFAHSEKDIEKTLEAYDKCL